MEILEQVQQWMRKMIERLLFEERLRRLGLFNLEAQEESHHWYKYLMLAVSLRQLLGFVFCWGTQAMLSTKMENLNKIPPKDVCMGTIKRSSKRFPRPYEPEESGDGLLNQKLHSKFQRG